MAVFEEMLLAQFSTENSTHYVHSRVLALAMSFWTRARTHAHYIYIVASRAEELTFYRTLTRERDARRNDTSSGI